MVGGVFCYDELIANKVNLDIWLKDDSLADNAELADPAILALSSRRFEVALQQFTVPKI